MKFVTASMLILAVFPLAVDAKRRRVPFMVCPSTKSNSGRVTVYSARSKIECSVICLNDPGCLSASYCKNTDGYTCQLSSFYAAGTCSGLPADGDCTQTAMMYPCENGGTFFLETRTCHCVKGFVGDYCQRRYRDCIETPQVIGELYLIQPLGSHSEFEWTCTSPTANYTKVSTIDTIFSLDYAITWQQIKLGVLMFQGFYILGAENMHKLTKQGRYDLMMVFIVTGKPFGQVYYKNFRVDSEAEGYACHWDLFQPDTTILPASYDYMDGLGGAGDPNKNLNGAGVGTYDKDINGCANANNAAWWYNPLGCTSLKFESNGIHWPTNRTGTVVLEPVYVTIIGMKPVYWYVEDDLVL